MFATEELRKPTNLTSLPPIIAQERQERPGRRLTAIYVKDNIRYEIDCRNSFCKTKCHFISSKFGEAIFDRESEKFRASTKSLDDHYFQFLKRTIKIWKKHFPNF